MFCILLLLLLLLPYLLTPWCRVLPEQLTVLQIVKKIPAFHGTRRFITALTRVRHLSLSWASPIQSTYPHPISWRSILILSTYLRLGLPSGLLPSDFPTKTLYTPLSSSIRATWPAHLILLDYYYYYYYYYYHYYYYSACDFSSTTALLMNALTPKSTNLWTRVLAFARFQRPDWRYVWRTWIFFFFV